MKMFQYLNSYSPVAMPHPLHVLAPELPEELVLEILDEVKRQRHHSAVPPVSNGLSFAEVGQSPSQHWLLECSVINPLIICRRLCIGLVELIARRLLPIYRPSRAS